MSIVKEVLPGMEYMIMQHEYWDNKWKTNDIQFHLPEANELLINYSSLLPKGKVFVPLCGKSLDMKWLLSQGYEIIGVELSEVACRAFFTDNDLSFSLKKQAPFTIFKSEHIEIWCGDIFQLPLDVCTNLTAIYDRAALIALPEEIRIQYVEFIKKLSKAQPYLDMLLLTIEYEQILLQGPPFSIKESDVWRLYADTFNITKLELPNDYTSVFSKNTKFQNIKTQEGIYWLTYSK